MKPWIEAIAARQVVVSRNVGAIEWDDVWPMMDDLDRLVALARGVERLAAEWDRRNDRLFDAHGGPTDYMKGVDDCAAELRRLLDGEKKP